jgi:hypothetical protein
MPSRRTFRPRFCSKPIMLLGVNGILVRANGNLPTYEDSEIFYSLSLIQAVSRWSDFIEIRWATQFSTEYLKSLTLRFSLPTFPIWDRKLFSESDLKRPIIFLDDLPDSMTTHLRRACQNRFMVLTWLADANDVVQEIDQFLELLSLRSYRFRVRLAETRNGSLMPFISQLDHLWIKSDSFPEISIKIRNLDGNYLTETSFVQFLAQHKSITPYVQHLGHAFDAIALHLQEPWRFNNVIDAIQNSNNLIILSYPCERDLPQPNPFILKIVPKKTPLIFLDVDGVINGNGSEVAMMNQFKDVSTVPCSSGNGFVDWPVVYAPPIVDKINEWSKVAEIRWHTSWKHAAKYRLAPLIGLNDFEVCKFAKRQTIIRSSHDPADLDRPMIWIDDQEADPQLQQIVNNEVLTIRPQNFLSLQDVACVDAFLNRVLTEEQSQ